MRDGGVILAALPSALPDIAKGNVRPLLGLSFAQPNSLVTNQKLDPPPC